MRKKEEKEIIEKIDQTFDVKKEMPKEQKEKIYKRIFHDVLLAIGIVVYFLFLNLGYINIGQSVFTTDLKVFSMSVLIIAILLFEYSYKDENGKIAIYGIEVLAVAIATLSSIYLLEFYQNTFQIVICIFSLVFVIYYMVKFFMIFRRMKKEYYKSLSDIKEIVKKESVQE